MKKLFDEFIAGTWGISHGALTLVAVLVTHAVTQSVYVTLAACVATPLYWVQREAKARGTWDIRTWYLDSQLDAIVPVVVGIVAAASIYLIYFR